MKVKCFKNTIDGKGLVRVNNKTLFIDDLLKDEEVIIKEEKIGKQTKWIIDRYLTKSEHRITSLCRHHKECGGCDFMHMSYDYELEIKNDYIKELFESTKATILPIVRMNNEYNYRNKSQMTYRLSKSKKVVCGLYEENSHNLVVIDNCMIQSKKSNEVISLINNILTKHKITPYNERTNEGIIRHIVVRYAFKSEELMITFVTKDEFFPGRNNVLKDILKLNLNIKTIVQNINPRESSIVLNDKERVLYGPGYITDSICDLKFRISSRSFYQVNSLSAETLYKRAISLSKITKKDKVLEAYCGIGTISLLLSKYALEVYAVELNKEAYKDALINQKINNINNVKFINSDATMFLNSLSKNKEETKIDVLFLDPPREGTTKEFIYSVKNINPKTIVYISCEPKTLKRDIKIFNEIGYYLNIIEPVDQFSRTSHIECIAVIKKR